MLSEYPTSQQTTFRVHDGTAVADAMVTDSASAVRSPDITPRTPAAAICPAPAGLHPLRRRSAAVASTLVADHGVGLATYSFFGVSSGTSRPAATKVRSSVSGQRTFDVH